MILLHNGRYKQWSLITEPKTVTQKLAVASWAVPGTCGLLVESPRTSTFEDRSVWAPWCNSTRDKILQMPAKPRLRFHKGQPLAFVRTTSNTFLAFCNAIIHLRSGAIAIAAGERTRFSLRMLLLHSGSLCATFRLVTSPLCNKPLSVHSLQKRI